MRRYWLRILVYIGAVLPLVWLIWSYSQNNLTVNPVKEIQLLTGKYAIILFVLTLAATPLSRLFRSRQLLQVRRPLGLFTFLYVCLHFLNFLVLDYGFDFGLIREDLFEKPFAVVGFASFLLLLPLAVTSTRRWMVRLGKNWKRLHWLVFPAMLLALVHFFWQEKAEIREPLVYTLVVLLFVLMRAPVMKKLTARLNQQPAEDTDPGY